MRRNRSAIVVLAALLAGAPAAAQRFYDDDPLDVEPAPMRVEEADFRKLNDFYDLGTNLFGKIGELQEEAEEPIPAGAVNTLGEPMDSAWWTRRHYYKRMGLAELKAGVGSNKAPAADGKWTVSKAKTEGVTPGFNIKDSTGTEYVLKFDPLDYPELATGADMITSKILHAVGYNVPEYYVVHFNPDKLDVGDDVEFRDAMGNEREMQRRDITELLLSAPRSEDGSWRAIASRWLPGRAVGEFRFYETRTDDPNDLAPHEHRRDLRGYRVFCAWVNHDDSRAINTLDMLHSEGGLQYIKHYLIDFGSTLGSATNGPNSARGGAEYLWNGGSTVKQLFSLGLWVPRWATKKYPKIGAAGNFESKVFDPRTWVPEYPNAAFVNALPDDLFWAAKQVMAFTDDQIRAIVETAEFSDARASEYVAKTLIERRDKIGKTFFADVLPVDRFAVQGGKLEFEDLEVKHGFVTSREHNVRWSEFDNQSGKNTPLPGANSFDVPSVADGSYLAAEISAERTGQTATVYVRRRGVELEVVGIDRSW
ncbi:MAG: hypothetical protein GY953_46205 [bacterium]|nr:hypothetical protein [bacterium]